MKFLPTLAACSLGIAAILWVKRHEDWQRLQREVLQKRLAIIKAGTPTTGPSGPFGDETTAEIQQLRALRPELHKLRGSIQWMRSQKDQDPELLEKQASAKKREADLIRASIQAEHRAKELEQSAHLSLMIATEASKVSGEPLPTSWESVRALLVKARDNQKPSAKELLDMLDEAMKSSTDLVAFEFLPLASPIRLQQRERSGHDVLYLRERQPRQYPDATWARLYVRVNGRVETATSIHADFSAWEQTHAGLSAAP